MRGMSRPMFSASREWNPLTLALLTSLWVAAFANWPLWRALLALPENASPRGALFVTGFGAMIAFEVKGGLPAGKRAYDRLALVARAVSLGDVRSLITHPASTTSASMPREDRLRGGITDGLMRMSVGIEDREDLWEDLSHALGE